MHNNTYEFKSYIDLVKWQIRQQNLNFRQVSKLTGIHPSYFSRVMKGIGRFSQMQLFLVADLLKFSEEQKNFLVLLWNYSESTLPTEKLFFKKKIAEIRNQKLKVSANISAPVVDPIHNNTQLEAYYSNAITAEIHMLLTLPQYYNNLEDLRKRVRLSSAKFEKELQKLREAGLIEINNRKVSKIQQNLHLDEEHPLSQRNHINWRLQSIQNLEADSPGQFDYHLSAVFSCDEQSKSQIRDILRKAVIAAQKIAEQCSNNNEVYHLVIDLF
jgi:hypothetical protein